MTDLWTNRCRDRGETLMTCTAIWGVTQELCTERLLSFKRCGCRNKQLTWPPAGQIRLCCTWAEWFWWSCCGSGTPRRGVLMQATSDPQARPRRSRETRGGCGDTLRRAEEETHLTLTCENNTEYSINLNIRGVFGAALSNRFITLWFIFNVNSIKLRGKTKQ